MYTDKQLGEMNEGGRQAAFGRMADQGSIGEIFGVSDIYRGRITAILKEDGEAKFRLALSDKAMAQTKGGTMKLRGANGTPLTFHKGEAKEVGFRNASHFFYTYGPKAPVQLHRDMIVCKGRVLEDELREQQQSELEKVREEAAKEKALAKAEAEKAKAEAEAAAAQLAQAQAEAEKAKAEAEKALAEAAKARAEAEKAKADAAKAREEAQAAKPEEQADTEVADTKPAKGKNKK